MVHKNGIDEAYIAMTFIFSLRQQYNVPKEIETFLLKMNGLCVDVWQKFDFVSIDHNYYPGLSLICLNYYDAKKPEMRLWKKKSNLNENQKTINFTNPLILIDHHNVMITNSQLNCKIFEDASFFYKPVLTCFDYWTYACRIDQVPDSCGLSEEVKQNNQHQSRFIAMHSKQSDNSFYLVYDLDKGFVRTPDVYGFIDNVWTTDDYLFVEVTDRCYFYSYSWYPGQMAPLEGNNHRIEIFSLKKILDKKQENKIFPLDNESYVSRINVPNYWRLWHVNKDNTIFLHYSSFDFFQCKFYEKTKKNSANFSSLFLQIAISGLKLILNKKEIEQQAEATEQKINQNYIEFENSKALVLQNFIRKFIAENILMQLQSEEKLQIEVKLKKESSIIIKKYIRTNSAQKFLGKLREDKLREARDSLSETADAMCHQKRRKKLFMYGIASIVATCFVYCLSKGFRYVRPC